MAFLMVSPKIPTLEETIEISVNMPSPRKNNPRISIKNILLFSSLVLAMDFALAVSRVPFAAGFPEVVLTAGFLLPAVLLAAVLFVVLVPVFDLVVSFKKTTSKTP